MVADQTTSVRFSVAPDDSPHSIFLCWLLRVNAVWLFSAYQADTQGEFTHGRILLPFHSQHCHFECLFVSADDDLAERRLSITDPCT